MEGEKKTWIFHVFEFYTMSIWANILYLFLQI